ncbi:M-phase inducer phosphatase-like [Melanaphis sacchari]|uniref:M-phase inducer phosphatase-like n=1 Tax=Melanaphis sacchari TaxID=742174 RepID=UPI000DC15674|nr:M-phase inducer phosphatase-like [Melanaphis sacchari]
MTSKLTEHMNLNCAVKLLRYDDPPATNNGAVVSVLPNNADISNQPIAEIKRSSRISRKRTKSIVEDSNESENVKKKKCMTKKQPQLNKIESEKTDTPQKEQKRSKIQNSSSRKSHKRRLIDDEQNAMSNNSFFSNRYLGDDGTTPMKRTKFKISKSIIAVKKKPVIHDINNDNPTNEVAKTKTLKSITSNKQKFELNNVSKNNTSYELEESNNSILTKVHKNKTPKSNTSNKKKSVVNVNKNGTTNEHETSNNIEIPKKRSRNSSKKEKSQRPDFDNMHLNEDNLKQTQDSDKIRKTLDTEEKLKLSQNFDNDTMMLKSNEKPPKIKKKWSEEWSGDKSFNNEEFSNDSTLNVNSCKTVKRIPKTQKSKNSNSKKAKTKTLEQLNPKDSLLTYSSITSCDNTDKSSFKVPVDQNNGISITFKIGSPIPSVYNTQYSETLSNSMIPTTGTNLQPISDSDYLSVSTISPENNEMSYGMAILSEAISRQCRELANENLKKKSPDPDTIETQSCPNKAKSTSRPQVPSAMVSPQRVIKSMSKRIPKYPPGLCLPSVENESESLCEHEIKLISKRFDIPINSLRRTVIDEPLSVFRKKYSKSVTPSMVTISPIVKDADSKSGLNLNYISGNIDVEYKLEPIREGAAYEKTNLKDLMLELSKTMPSWSLSIVTNPPRYVISQMSIGKYGVPNANKCIVIDRMFRASVYINQSLEHKLSKRYTTATEIVNLIKELNSI